MTRWKIIFLVFFVLFLPPAAFSQSVEVSIKAERQSVRKLLRQAEAQSGYHFFYSSRVLDSSERITIDTHGPVPLEAFLKRILPSKVDFEIRGNVVVLMRKEPSPTGPKTVLPDTVTPKIDEQALSLSLLLDETVIVGYGTLKKQQLVGAVETLAARKLDGRGNVDITRSLQGQMPGLNIIQLDGKPSHGGEIYIRGNSMKYQSRKGLYDATSSTYSMGLEGSALVLVDGVESSLKYLNPKDILSISLLKDAASAAVYGSRGAYGVILVTTKTPANGSVRVDYGSSLSVRTRTVRWEDRLVTDGYTWAGKFIEFFQGDQRVPEAAGSYPSSISNTLPFSQTYYEELASRPKNDNVTTLNDGSWLYYGNTNWYELIYRRHNFAQNHSVNVQASAERFSWMLSGRYYGQDTIYKIADENFHTINLRSKGIVQLTPWLRFENNTSFYNNLYRQPTLSAMSSVSGNLYAQIERYGTPLAIPFNPDGTYTLNAGLSGFQALDDGRTFQLENGNSLCTITSLDASFLEGLLKFKAEYAYQCDEDGKTRIAVPLLAYKEPDLVVDIYNGGYKQKWQYDLVRHTVNAVATADSRFGEVGSGNFILGFNLKKESRRVLYTSMKQFLDPDYPSFSLMPSDPSNYPSLDENGSYDKGLVGFFTRMNLTFLDRYIFEFAGRYDGSSLFPPNKKWGFFPSASLGWRITQEPWMERLKPWISNLKLRANLGNLGSEMVSPYTYIPTYTTQKSGVLINGSKISCVSLPTLVFTDLSWSTVTTWDLGLDADLLGNRLSMSGDLFCRDTKDLYINGPSLPAVLGTSTPKGNYGALSTYGWEVTLRWNERFQLAGSPMDFSIKSTLWDARTWVTCYNTTSQSFYDLYPGKEIGEIWGFRTDGYFLNNEEAASWVPDEFHKNGTNYRAYSGDLRFLDLNGNGKIDIGKGTLEDSGDIVRIGNSTPRYHFGIDMSVQYRSFALSLFFQGIGRRDWYPDVESGFFWGMYNRPYGYLPYEHLSNGVQIDYSDPAWPVLNADSHPYWTRPVGYCANRNVGPLSMANDYYLQNAAYLRLKNILLEWNIPEKWCEKIKISSLKIWASADNLFTFSPIYAHTSMFDPEVICSGDSDFYTTSGLYGAGEGYSYPMHRAVTFGFDISF